MFYFIVGQTHMETYRFTFHLPLLHLLLYPFSRFIIIQPLYPPSLLYTLQPLSSLPTLKLFLLL